MEQGTQAENEIGRLCGKLLAQAEIAQADAVASVNRPGGTRITARYYDYCVNRPAKAFPEIMNMIRLWTDKIDYGTGDKITQSLKQLESLGTDKWPQRFTNQQKCFFAQGYNLEIASLREERTERIMEAIRRKEEKETRK